MEHNYCSKVPDHNRVDRVQIEHVKRVTRRVDISSFLQRLAHGNEA